MNTGMYKISLKDHRRRMNKLCTDAKQAYDCLTGKDSAYAREILALLELHEKVLAIYKTAPDDTD